MDSLWSELDNSYHIKKIFRNGQFLVRNTHNGSIDFVTEIEMFRGQMIKTLLKCFFNRPLDLMDFENLKQGRFTKKDWNQASWDVLSQERGNFFNAHAFNYKNVNSCMAYAKRVNVRLPLFEFIETHKTWTWIDKHLQKMKGADNERMLPPMQNRFRVYAFLRTLNWPNYSDIKSATKEAWTLLKGIGDMTKGAPILGSYAKNEASLLEFIQTLYRERNKFYKNQGRLWKLFLFE
jgi:hypothetical protein